MRTIINYMPRWSTFRRGKYTVEIGYPWLARGSIMALERVLTPEFKVLEFGCGGSTVFFSKRCKSVKSIEYSQEWIDKVKAKIGEESNVTFQLIDKTTIIDRLKEEPDDYYDLILDDIGNDLSWLKIRLAIANLVHQKLKKNGFLVIDNYMDRYVNRIRYDGFDIYTFDEFNYPGKGTRICIKQ